MLCIFDRYEITIMCGRYFFDNETMDDIERLTGEPLDRDLFEKGDIYPSAEGLVLTGEKDLQALKMHWGFPGFQKNRLIINARAETAWDKKMFSDSLLHRRCIIPAKWFYEWDRDKNKVVFTLPESPSVYMAGFYDNRDSKNCYVILTTQANDSMKKVHDRMPLILHESRIKDWIFDSTLTRSFLSNPSPGLSSRQDYEQLSFF